MEIYAGITYLWTTLTLFVELVVVAAAAPLVAFAFV